MWIYGLAFSVYIVFFCLLFTRGPIALIMKDEERNAALFYLYLLTPTVSILASIVLHAAAIFQASKATIILTACVSLAAAVASSSLYYKTKPLLQPADASSTSAQTSTPEVQREPIEAAPAAQPPPKPRKTILSIPYYVSKTDSGGSLFRPADRFDLLKLSVRLLASQKSNNGKKQKRDKVALFGK